MRWLAALVAERGDCTVRWLAVLVAEREDCTDLDIGTDPYIVHRDSVTADFDIDPDLDNHSNTDFDHYLNTDFDQTVPDNLLGSDSHTDIDPDCNFDCVPGVETDPCSMNYWPGLCCHTYLVMVGRPAVRGNSGEVDLKVANSSDWVLHYKKLVCTGSAQTF